MRVSLRCRLSILALLLPLAACGCLGPKPLAPELTVAVAIPPLEALHLPVVKVIASLAGVAGARAEAVPVSGNATMTFADLPPGHWALSVRALDAEGNRVFVGVQTVDLVAGHSAIASPELASDATLPAVTRRICTYTGLLVRWRGCTSLSGQAAPSYQVRIGQEGSGDPVVSVTLPSGTRELTKDLAPGAYWVATRAGDGDSGYGDWWTDTADVVAGPPAPTGLVAAAPGPGGGLTAYWNAAPSLNADNAFSTYTVALDGPQPVTQVVPSVPNADTPWDLWDLAAGDYRIHVGRTDISPELPGHPAVDIQSGLVHVNYAPPAPAANPVTADDSTDTITLTWQLAVPSDPLTQHFTYDAALGSQVGKTDLLLRTGLGEGTTTFSTVMAPGTYYASVRTNDGGSVSRWASCGFVSVH